MTSHGPLAALPPLGESPRVSVVVPARDAAATLRDAVESALAQDWPDLEVVVAVGPSRDGTRELAHRLAELDQRVRLADNPLGVTPAGLNAAIDVAKGEVLVRLDAHAVLPPGYVRRAVGALRETGAANVGGRQAPVAEDGFAAAVAAAMASPVGAGGAAYRRGDRSGEVETVYLGVFRRDALEHVGGFDERLVRNQDYELNHRLRDAGGTVWLDRELAVAYRPRATVGGLWRQYWQYGRWKRVTLRLHPGSLHVRQLAAPLLVVGLAGAAVLSVVLGAWWPILVAAAVYLAVVVAGAVTSGAPATRWPAVALALVVMHLAWGLGFVVGPPRGALATGQPPGAPGSPGSAPPSGSRQPPPSSP